MYSLIRALQAASKSSAFSSTSAASQKASATMAFRVVLAAAMESLEPTMRNSNLLPVKAKGEVRFRSVASLVSTGTVETPEFRLPALAPLWLVPETMLWTISFS